MKTIQDIFLIFVIFLKLFYIISEFALGIYKKRKSINPKKLEKLEYYNEQMYLISQIGMFLLLAIIFKPWGPKEITVTHHEKLIFFSIGIIGLTHIQYRALFKK